MYYRLAQAVSFSNSFIKNASELSGDEVSVFVAEARFLRAYAYYNLLDLYGNVPLTTEISTELPTQSNRTELFNFIESELMEIESSMLASNEYGRVDNVAAHALLSRLYLNAEAWTGQDRYADCITYSQNVINSGYTLNMNVANGNGTAYDELFIADNDVTDFPEPDSPTIPTVSPLLIDVEIFFSIDISLPSWLLKPIDRLLIFCIISFILYWCFLGTINSKSFS